MAPPLEALARAMSERDMRLAVFDVGLRERTGQWQLDTHIAADQAVAAFAGHDAFADEDGRVRIPLHESDSPALTDEYVVADTAGSPALVYVYDPARHGYRELRLDTFGGTYPAWRMRYWTDAYSIEDEPPFVQAFPEASPTLGGARSVSGTDGGPDPESFFEAARSAVVAERDATRAAARSAFGGLSAAEFVDERGGIRDLRPGERDVDEFGQQVVTLRLPEDHRLAGEDADTLSRETSLYPGDEVIVDSPEREELPVEAELFEFDGDRLALGIYWDSARGTHAEAAFDPGADVSFTVGKLVDGARFEAIGSALETVERTDRMRALYTGSGELNYAGDPPDAATLEDLNRYQTEAVLRAATAEDLLCIHAAPWTGSRRTIWHVIRLAAEEDRRVAILTPDGPALDVLLGDRDQADTVARRLRDAGISVSRVDRGDEAADPGSAAVVAAPLDLADRLTDHAFDLAIVDQAARIGVPGGAVAFAKAGRILLVGDPMQSPRSPVARELDTDLPTSIYEHLTAAYGEDSLERLRCQYRMNQAIALFPNRAFYDGGLIHGQRNRTWTVDAAPPLDAVHVAGREQETPTGSLYNEAEVQAIREEVRDLLDRGLPAAEIGIITPYSAQIGKIRVALEKELDEGASDVAVGGIDAFRCRHRDAVIVSAVRTRPPAEWIHDEVAPFWTDRGLNVAMTRACKRLVFVGDWRTLQDRGAGDPFAGLGEFLTDRGLLADRLE